MHYNMTIPFFIEMRKYAVTDKEMYLPVTTIKRVSLYTCILLTTVLIYIYYNSTIVLHMH